MLAVVNLSAQLPHWTQQLTGLNTEGWHAMARSLEDPMEVFDVRHPGTMERQGVKIRQIFFEQPVQYPAPAHIQTPDAIAAWSLRVDTALEDMDDNKNLWMGLSSGIAGGAMLAAFTELGLHLADPAAHPMREVRSVSALALVGMLVAFAAFTVVLKATARTRRQLRAVRAMYQRRAGEL